MKEEVENIETDIDYSYIKVDNLYDQLKYEILVELMDNCNLETLEEIKNIYLSDGKYEGKLLESTYKKLVNRFKIKG